MLHLLYVDAFLIRITILPKQGFLFKQVYAALRFSQYKNKAVILDIYWDCGFLGVKDRIIK